MTAGDTGRVATSGNIVNNNISISRNTETTLATIAGVAIKIKLPASDNTWRGIQDNLTSSTNTTESLSAKQGYLLANGDARDNTKVTKITSTTNAIAKFSGETGELANTGITIADTTNIIQYNYG